MTMAILTKSVFDVSCYYIHIVYNKLLSYDCIQSITVQIMVEKSVKLKEQLTLSGIITGQTGATAPKSVGSILGSAQIQ